MSLERWASPRPDVQPRRIYSCGHLIQSGRSLSQNESCPSCGKHAALPDASTEDFVPSPTLTWEWASRSSSCPLDASDGTLSRPVIEHVSELVAAISIPQARQLVLGTTVLHEEDPDPAVSSFLVWRADAADCTVFSGTVQLPEWGVLLLAGRGAHFHGTTFTGGVVMCAGPQYTGTFQNCTFESAPLYAVHGAAVTLCSCEINSAPFGLTVSGGATLATLVRCTIRNCYTGIVAERGATVAAAHCTVECVRSGVIVNGAGSCAVLTRCHVVGGMDGPDSFGAVCVSALRGSACLSGCHFTRFMYAIVGMFSTTVVESVAVRVSECARGADLSCGAQATLRSCDFDCVDLTDKRKQEIAALTATGDDGCARMQLERCAVHNGADYGLCVKDRGSVTAQLCRFDCWHTVLQLRSGRVVLAHCRGTAPHGLTADSPAAMLRLEGGCFVGNTVACAAQEGATLSAADCELYSQSVPDFGGVVTVNSKAHAWLCRCNIHDGCFGIYSTYSTVHVIDSVIRDITIPTGAGGRLGQAKLGSWVGATGCLCSHGTIIMRGGSVRRCWLGVESALIREGDVESSMNVTDVLFEDCVMGLATLRSKADVVRCDIRGPGCGMRSSLAAKVALDLARHANGVTVPRHLEAGVCLRLSPESSISHCKIKGFPLGVSVSRADASVYHCEITVDRDPGLGVLTGPNAKVAVEDCNLLGEVREPAGVQVADGGDCAIRRCKFLGMRRDAVHVLDGCKLRILSSTMAEECRGGVFVEGQAEVAVQDCSMRGMHTGIFVVGCGAVVTAKRVRIETDVFGVYFSEQSSGPGRRATVLKLMHVDVIGGSIAGVKLNNTPAELWVTQCSVSEAKTGLDLRGPSVAHVSATRITQCEVGVVVGEALVEGSTECKACGQSGVKARRAAYAALSGHRGTPPPSAVCAHQGAVATLHIQGGEIAQCLNHGLLVNVSGHVEAQRLTVRRCNMGIESHYISKGSAFSDCEVIGCIQRPKEVKRVSADGGTDAAGAPIPGLKVTGGLGL